MALRGEHDDAGRVDDSRLIAAQELARCGAGARARAHGVDQMRDVLGIEHDVRVQRQVEFARRLRDQVIVAAGEPPILVQVAPLSGRGQRVEPRACVVARRGVVGDEELDTRVSLGADGREAGIDVAGVVPGDEADRHQRQIGRRG
jgi:hypothetical protein